MSNVKLKIYHIHCQSLFSIIGVFRHAESKYIYKYIFSWVCFLGQLKERKGAAAIIAVMKPDASTLATLLRGNRKTELRAAIEDAALMKDILEELTPEDRLNLAQAKLNSCEDRLLHFALRVGGLATIKLVMSLLAEQGTAVVFSVLKEQNIHGDTALHIAVQMENTEALRVFLHSSDSEYHFELLSITDRKSRIIKMYNCGDPRKSLTLTTKGLRSCSTSLHVAASLGNESLVRCMLDSLKHSQDQYSLLAVQNSIGFSAIHTAVAEGHPRCITAMLNPLPHDQREALLMAQDDWGSTAQLKPSTKVDTVLHRKAENYKQNDLWEISNPTSREITLLIPSLAKTAMLTVLEADAKARTFDGIFQSWGEDRLNGSENSLVLPYELGDTAVKMAFDRQKLECFEALLSLLEPGARIAFLMRMRDPRSMDTPLHMATEKNHIGLVSCLVNAADPDSRLAFLQERGKSGDTALHRASAGSRPDVIKTIHTDV